MAETLEQQAREMLVRAGVREVDAMQLSSGDLVEVANLLGEVARLRKLLTRKNLPFAGTNAFVIGPGFCLWCGRSEPDHFDNCEYASALRGPAQSETP